MSFSDVQKTHADFIVNHVRGEQVGYRRHPSFEFVQMRANVRRNPVDVSTGEVLSNTLEVFVSKTDVPLVNVGKDEIKLTQAVVPLGQAAPRYTVDRIIDELPGSFILQCSE